MTPRQEKCELKLTGFSAPKATNKKPQLSRKLGFIVSSVCRTPGVSKTLRCSFYTANHFSLREGIVALFICSIDGAWTGCR